MLKNHSDDSGLVLIAGNYYDINDPALLAKLDADKSGTKCYITVANVPEFKQVITINPPEPPPPPEGGEEGGLGFLPGVKPPEPVQLPADDGKLPVKDDGKPGEDDKPEHGKPGQHPADKPKHKK